MRIEQFVAESEGQWRSMRSGHSIAFKQFEQIISKLTITILRNDDPKVIELLRRTKKDHESYISPFHIEWQADNDWNEQGSSEINSGSSILIPIPKNNQKGLLIRSVGYIEDVLSLSTYSFLNDGTFKLRTVYDNTVTEERIWFLSKQVRCRSSVVYTGKESGIMQTSFASEIKVKNQSEADDN
tara:strand:+ start:1373 stop:1924 length:552 start_codon:yes stop_codon:yes gene_type:complete